MQTTSQFTTSTDAFAQAILNLNVLPCVQVNRQPVVCCCIDEKGFDVLTDANRVARKSGNNLSVSQSRTEGLIVSSSPDGTELTLVECGLISAVE